ncbi:uncharacterized protein LOC143757150 [Siphateles boraxobius]|uniref:uncharacterized protein LOC143757150 n=1 Tax=Siphateles boraxobius TaxID=180520 RepID=UPI0040634ACA
MSSHGNKDSRTSSIEYQGLSTHGVAQTKDTRGGMYCGAVMHIECAAPHVCYICQADPDLLDQPSRSADGFVLQQEETVMSMLEAIGKPMAICSEEEMEDKEEEMHEQHNEERHREDEGVEEKERKVYKVLGRLTAQGKSR